MTHRSVLQVLCVIMLVLMTQMVMKMLQIVMKMTMMTAVNDADDLVRFMRTIQTHPSNR